MAAAVLATVWLFACVSTSLEQGLQAYAAGDWATARRAFATHLGTADSEVLVLWGDLLRDGKGGPADPVGAAQAYARAAEAGHAPAQARLRSLADGGNAEALYRAGLAGVRHGASHGEGDLERAAALGHPDAAAWLGHRRASEQRYDEARELLGVAAREGVVAAGYTLAMMHFDGIGAPPNPAAAERVLIKTGTAALARLGITAASVNAPRRLTGRAIDNAPGLPHSVGFGDYLADFAPLFEVAAWRDHAEEDLRAGRTERALVFLRALAVIPTHERDAAFRIAEIYDQGVGVPEDDQAAMRWYERAAAAGSETAPARLRELRRAAARQ